MRKWIKQYVSVFLCLFFCIVLIGCGKEQNEGKTDLQVSPGMSLTLIPEKELPESKAEWEEKKSGDKVIFSWKMTQGNIKVVLQSPKTIFYKSELGKLQTESESFEVKLRLEYTGTEQCAMLANGSGTGNAPSFFASFSMPDRDLKVTELFFESVCSEDRMLKASALEYVEYTCDFTAFSKQITEIGTYKMTFLADFVVKNEAGKALEGPYCFSVELPFEVREDTENVWDTEELSNAAPDDFALVYERGGLLLDTKNQLVANGDETYNCVEFLFTKERADMLYEMLLCNNVFSLFRTEFTPFYNSRISFTPRIYTHLTVTCNGKEASFVYVTPYEKSDGTKEQDILSRLDSELMEFILESDEYKTISVYADWPD